MASVMAFFISSLALILAILFTKSHVTEASGFTVDLIHRDSLLSPVPTPSQRVKNAIQRSLLRALVQNHGSQQPPSVDIIPDIYEYLMRFSLGTPPVEILAYADTGSDVTWTQCRPCTKCLHQDRPLFNSVRSSSYRPIPCTSKICTSFESQTSCDRRKVCSYGTNYFDGSKSTGYLAKETITLGSTNVMIPNVTIGCAHLVQSRTLGGGPASGIAGLGAGKASLISQMGSIINGKFSYCLVQNLKPSKMYFGDNAVVSGDDVLTTPMFLGNKGRNYYLTLEAITVGNQRLEFYDNLDMPSNSNGSKAIKSDGNIIIDSGTTLTVVPRWFYDRVVRAVKTQVTEREIDPQGGWELCYLNGVRVPDFTAHFKGADVKLNSLNTFLKNGETSFCLAFAPTKYNIAYYGNTAQMNFLVGYDLIKKTVSFKPTDCTRA